MRTANPFALGDRARLPPTPFRSITEPSESRVSETRNHARVCSGTSISCADGLSGDEVRGLHEDAKGNVLIATNSGVSKFDGQGFATLEFVAEPTLLKDWVLEHGIHVFDGTKFERFQPPKAQAVKSTTAAK